MYYEDLLNDLDTLLEAQDNYTAKQIDAACCQTDSDYRRRDTAEQKFWDKKEAFIGKLEQLFKEIKKSEDRLEALKKVVIGF